VARKGFKEAKKMPEGTEKENKIKGAIFLERILVSNSLRSMSMSSSGAMPYNFAEGFRDLSNGHLLRGIKDFTSKIKAPNLPSDKEGK
jgi:beta-glucosidase